MREEEKRRKRRRRKRRKRGKRRKRSYGEVEDGVLSLCIDDSDDAVEPDMHCDLLVDEEGLNYGSGVRKAAGLDNLKFTIKRERERRETEKKESEIWRRDERGEEGERRRGRRGGGNASKLI